MIDQELKTFLIVKYGSVENMCNLWFAGEVKNVSSQEKEILEEFLGINAETIDILYKKAMRTKYGIYE